MAEPPNDHLYSIHIHCRTNKSYLNKGVPVPVIRIFPKVKQYFDKKRAFIFHSSSIRRLIDYSYSPSYVYSVGMHRASGRIINRPFFVSGIRPDSGCDYRIFGRITPTFFCIRSSGLILDISTVCDDHISGRIPDIRLNTQPFVFKQRLGTSCK